MVQLSADATHYTSLVTPRRSRVMVLLIVLKGFRTSLWTIPQYSMDLYRWPLPPKKILYYQSVLPMAFSYQTNT